MLLDADNVPVTNPEYLFDTPQYRRTGAIFWPDYGRLAPDRPAWQAFGVRYRDEPEFETGQIVIDKQRCWEPLNLSMWYNEHSDFYYHYVYGDKDTFHMAFRRLGRPYAMPVKGVHGLDGTMCQHDFNGRRLFQHRHFNKWSLATPNKRVQGFLFEPECRAYLDQLKRRWDGRKAAFFTPGGSPAGNAHWRPRAHRTVRLVACMVSCSAHDSLRRQTLRRLAATDWGQRPVLVVMEQERFPSPSDRFVHAAWRALRQCLQTAADYIFYLEDGLSFNRHVRQNLESWPPLRRGDVTFASLYNPGLRELAWDVDRNATVVEPESYYGTRALLIARPLVQYFVEHWFEGPSELDQKWKALVCRLKVPILLHSPSLVQRHGWRAAVGERYPWAIDFSPGWKSLHPQIVPPLKFVTAPEALQP